MLFGLFVDVCLWCFGGLGCSVVIVVLCVCCCVFVCVVVCLFVCVWCCVLCCVLFVVVFRGGVVFLCWRLLLCCFVVNVGWLVC